MCVFLDCNLFFATNKKNYFFFWFLGDVVSRQIVFFLRKIACMRVTCKCTGNFHGNTHGKQAYTHAYTQLQEVTFKLVQKKKTNKFKKKNQPKIQKKQQKTIKTPKTNTFIKKHKKKPQVI